MKRVTLSFLALASLLGVAFLAWQKIRAGAHTIKFTTATATRGDVIATVTATGQLQPVINVQVGSQVSGLVRELLVDFNSPVTKDQVIARLDDAAFTAALHSARGNLAAAESDLHAAQLNATRTRDLLAKFLVAQSDMDAANSAVEKAVASVAIAEANVEKAQLDLDHCTITSPVDGIVTSRNVDVGQTVAASLSATTLFTIAADLTKMQIVAEVAESDIGQVRAGEKVTFTVDAYPSRQFSGEVAQVRYAPRTIDSVVNYDTVINVANADLALLPGMTASTAIVAAEHDHALLVPNAALRVQLTAPASDWPKSGDGGPRRAAAGSRPAGAHGAGTPPRTLYTLADTPDAQPERQRVRVGISDGQMTEILNGVSEGERIVVAALAPTATPAARPTSPLAGGGGGMVR